MKKGLQVHITGPTGSGKTLLKTFIETRLNETHDSPLLRQLRENGVAIHEHTAPEGCLVNVQILIPDPANTPPKDWPSGGGLQVLSNPLTPKDSLPWVKFRAGKGWAIVDGKNKSPFYRQLVDAVQAWNESIGKEYDSLNLAGYESHASRVNELPGWGDAVRDEMTYRRELEKAAGRINFHAAPIPQFPGPVFPTPQDWGSIPPPPPPTLRDYQRKALDELADTLKPCQCEICKTGQGDSANDFFDGFFKAILGVDKPIKEPDPAIVAMLDQVGWLERIGPVGAVKVPRRLPKDYVENLLSAIEGNDVVKVAQILAAVPAP